jgi:hypothetical protein
MTEVSGMGAECAVNSVIEPSRQRNFQVATWSLYDSNDLAVIFLHSPF